MGMKSQTFLWLVVLAAIMLLAALSGCVDRGQCLHAHYEESGYWNYIYGTNMQLMGMYWVDTSGNVCDRWEFPDGKPKSKE